MAESDAGDEEEDGEWATDGEEEEDEDEGEVCVAGPKARGPVGFHSLRVRVYVYMHVYVYVCECACACVCVCVCVCVLLQPRACAFEARDGIQLEQPVCT